MKKNTVKGIKIVGILFFTAVLFFNLSLDKINDSHSINLSTLVKINKANAECTSNGPLWDFGQCNEGYDICYYVGMGGYCDPRY
jgi:hypothetical protein